MGCSSAVHCLQEIILPPLFLVCMLIHISFPHFVGKLCVLCCFQPTILGDIFLREAHRLGGEGAVESMGLEFAQVLHELLLDFLQIFIVVGFEIVIFKHGHILLYFCFFVLVFGEKVGQFVHQGLDFLFAGGSVDFWNVYAIFCLVLALEGDCLALDHCLLGILFGLDDHLLHFFC